MHGLFVIESMVLLRKSTYMVIQVSPFREFLSACFLLWIHSVASNLLFSTLFDRYVPTHLHLMVYELVKNSLRAVQERYVDSDRVAPPVRIIVADGIEDVTIKVICFLLCARRFVFC